MLRDKVPWGRPYGRNMYRKEFKSRRDGLKREQHERIRCDHFASIATPPATIRAVWVAGMSGHHYPLHLSFLHKINPGALAKPENILLL